MQNHFDKASFKDASLKVFSVWYDENKNKFGEISNYLMMDLNGYKKMTGNNKLAFFDVRVKSKSSFLDKIENIQNNEKKLDALFNKKKLRIDEIVRDIIGARLVMYFENDIDLPFNFFDVYPKFKIEEAKVYSVITDKSPLFHDGYRKLYERLNKIDATFKPNLKASAYESLHLTVRYNDPYSIINYFIPAGKGNATISKSKKEKFNQTELGVFPIEVQIRTILQHTWAQVEHCMNYNLIKRKQNKQIDDELFWDDFKCHKSLLYSAEHHQRIMYERFWILNRSNSIKIKQQSLEFGDFELKYFEREFRDEIKEINNGLFGGKKSQSFKKLVSLLSKYEKKYNYRLLDNVFEDDLKKWACKRPLFMILGQAVLLKCDTTLKKRILNLIGKYFDIAFKEDVLISITIYEYVRFQDTYFRWRIDSRKKDRILFSDPLLNYRCAGVHLKLKDFKRSIHLLEEAIENKYIENYSITEEAESILTVRHFYRRIAEYYFFLYAETGMIKGEYLNAAYENTQKGLKYKKSGNKKIYAKEQTKLAANLIVIYFYKYLFVEYPNRQTFKAKIDELKANSKLIKMIITAAGEKKGVEAQAVSLIEYCNNEINASCTYIDESRKYIEKYTENPIYSMIVTNIYDFLCDEQERKNESTS